MFQIFHRYLPPTHNDSSEPWGLFFQDNRTFQMEGSEKFSNIPFYLVVSLLVISLILILLNYKTKKFNKYIDYDLLLELMWVTLPALILVLIAFSSFKLLYIMDVIIDPSLIIYGEGHQWYWSYEYPDFTIIRKQEFVEFDSYIMPENNIYTEKIMMSKINNRVIFPELIHANIVESYSQFVKLYLHMSLFLQNYLLLDPAFDKSPEFVDLLFQDSSSECSSISDIPPLEEARQDSITSNGNLREAKFNVHLNQANTFDLIERVVNRELSDTARSTFSDINNDRQDAANEINSQASRETLNSLTEAGRAMIETQATYCNMLTQQVYLDKGISVVQDCGLNLTRNEQTQCDSYLNENPRLWEEYRQAHIQHVNNLDRQIPLDSVDVSRDGIIRRTSLVQEYANTTNDSSDSD